MERASVRLLTEQKAGCQHLTEVSCRGKKTCIYIKATHSKLLHYNQLLLLSHGHLVVPIYNDPSLVAAQGGSILAKGPFSSLTHSF